MAYITTRRQKLLICTFCSFLWTFIGIMIGSVSVLDILQYGIQASNFSYSLFSTLYTPGRYLLGPGYTFVEFPSTVQILVMSDTQTNEKQNLEGAQFTEQSTFGPSLQLRTSDGVQVAVDCLIFYTLNNSGGGNLMNIYSNLAKNWPPYVQQVVSFELGNIVSLYNATELLQNQFSIGNLFQQNLSASISTDYFTIVSATISNIEFINQTFVEELEQISMVSYNISILKQTVGNQETLENLVAENAEVEATNMIILAKSQAQIQQMYYQAIANSTNYTLTLKQQGLTAAANNLELVDDFQFTRAEKLLTLYWIAIELLNFTSTGISVGVAMDPFQINAYGF